MQVDFLCQLEELIKAFGIHVMYLSRQKGADMEVDQGLRRSLYHSYDMLTELGYMEQYYEEKILYIARDSFEENYLSFLVPEGYRKQSEKEFLVIGPFIMEDADCIADKVIEQNQLPICLMNELREYYRSVPLLVNMDALEGIVLTQMGYIFGDREGIEIRRNFYKIDPKSKEVNYDEEPGLSMAAIEERYLYEEMMINAIQMGDVEKVMEANEKFRQYRLKPRSEDTLRNTKNLMVVWNTLFRKAVQQAAVHPAHIDGLSETFARKIESCTHVGELQTLSHEMIHKYCLLVQNYSKRGYTSIVRDALNYVDFNIREPLSLKQVSKQINVSSSYLSAQFKKETGKTLTEYVNEKRIRDSLVYLATSELPIRKVAEQVGIYDENYYSRLFKKYVGQTAKQYRNMMKLKYKK